MFAFTRLTPFPRYSWNVLGKKNDASTAECCACIRLADSCMQYLFKPCLHGAGQAKVRTTSGHMAQDLINITLLIKSHTLDKGHIICQFNNYPWLALLVLPWACSSISLRRAFSSGVRLMTFFCSTFLAIWEIFSIKSPILLPYSVGATPQRTKTTLWIKVLWVLIYPSEIREIDWNSPKKMGTWCQALRKPLADSTSRPDPRRLRLWFDQWPPPPASVSVSNKKMASLIFVLLAAGSPALADAYGLAAFSTTWASNHFLSRYEFLCGF